MFLRQSTAQTIRFGPFLDSTDGVTAETGLTVAQADRQVSKDGGAFAQSNHAGNSTHDTDGWYSDDLDATDTNTVGELILQVVVSGALPVWVRYWVIEEAIYDALYGASAAGFDGNQRVDVGSVLGTAQTAGDIYGVLGSGIGAETRDANLLDQLRKITMVVESQRGAHTHQPIGDILFVDPVNGDTHANGNRGGISDPYLGVQDCHDNAVTDSNHDLIILLSGAAAGATTLTEDVTLSKRYLFIRGPGRDFIWTRSGSGDTISVTADGIELSGFQLQTAATGSGAGVQATDADFLRVENVWINDTQGDGIEILRGENCQIVNNHFQGSGAGGSGQGIHVIGTAGTSNNNVIRGNEFWDTQGDGILIEQGTTNNTRIIDNRIEGSSGWGINIGGSSTDAFVLDNRLGNNTSGGINDGGTTSVLMNNEQWAKDSVCTEARLAELDAANLPADVDAILADTADIQPKIGTPAADLSADIAAVKVDTAAILVDTADIQPKIGTPVTDVSADIAAVKTDTAAILIDTADIQPKIGTPAADLSADIAAVKVDTAATLVDTGTAGVQIASGQTAGWASSLEASAGQIIEATVDTATNGHTPTTTEFQSDTITEATADHYNGRLVVFVSGALAGQATDITDYSAVGGIGQFTVTAMTEAPANNDLFIIV